MLPLPPSASLGGKLETSRSLHYRSFFLRMPLSFSWIICVMWPLFFRNPCSKNSCVESHFIWFHLRHLSVPCKYPPPHHTHTYMLHLSTALLFWQAKSHLRKSILLWRMHRNVKIIFIFNYAVVEFINIISPPYPWMGNPPKERTNWTVPVYTWDLSTCEFSYPQGSWTQMPLDAKRRLYLK